MKQILQLTLYNQKSEEAQRRTQVPTAEQLLANWHMRPNFNRTIWLQAADIAEVADGNHPDTSIILLESGGMYELEHTKVEVEELLKLAQIADLESEE